MLEYCGCGKEVRRRQMKFFEGGVGKLALSALTKDYPAYVQFYVTARCNLTCEQCNIIYANADQEECTTEQAFKIAENLARIGTSVVLLTGGEPFVRRDIVRIAKAMMDNGIHPRLQTNGLASRKQLEEMVAIGAHDISVSLDSVLSDVQDEINGGFNKSWERAINTISMVNEIFPVNSFCVIGCVLAPKNIKHITGVIKLATAIGWWVSLVPAHQTQTQEPRSFSTYDPKLCFQQEQYAELLQVLADVKKLRDSGYNVYDSDEYLDDIYRFITRGTIEWRRRNGGLCDSPNLYFAIQPNGDMSVCCDYRLPESVPVYSADFPEQYRSEILRQNVTAVTGVCTGCMYGSFPEISISARFFVPMFRRAKLFLLDGMDRQLKRLTKQEIIEIANNIAVEHGLK